MNTVLYRGKEIDVVEYDPTLHGEIPYLPQKLFPHLLGLSIADQLKHIHIYYDNIRIEDYQKEDYEDKLGYYYPLSHYNSYCRGIIVKDNQVVGIMFAHPYSGGSVQPLYLFNGVYLYTPEDNNGAGYKYGSDVYLSLIIIKNISE